MLDQMKPLWDAATGRITFDLPPDFGAMITPVFSGQEKMRVRLVNLNDTTEVFLWTSCDSGGTTPGGAMPSGTPGAVANIPAPRRYAIEAFHANGMKCGQPGGTATFRYAAAPVDSNTQDDTVPHDLESTVRTFIATNGSTQVIIVIRFENGGNGETMQQRTDALLAKLKKEARGPHRTTAPARP